MNRLFVGFLALAAMALASWPVVADDAANEALARRFYTEFNARNLDAFDEFIAADVVDHTAAPGMATGLAAMKEEMQGFIAAFSDIKVENDLVLVSGDYVTVISTAKGTNDGMMMDMPATNKPVDFKGIDVWLVRDGKLAEIWHVEQLLQMMTQMGAMQPPAANSQSANNEAPARGRVAPAPKNRGGE
jgi:predicted ester cyclase